MRVLSNEFLDNVSNNSVAMRFDVSIPAYIILEFQATLPGSSWSLTLQDDRGTITFQTGFDGISFGTDGAIAARELGEAVHASDLACLAKLDPNNPLRLVLTGLPDNTVLAVSSLPSAYISTPSGPFTSQLVTFTYSDVYPELTGVTTTVHNCVNSVSSFTTGIDALDRTLEPASMEVILANTPTIEYLRTYFSLTGTEVETYIGVAGPVNTSQFVWTLLDTYYILEVTDAEPGATVRIEMTDILGMLGESTVSGNVVARHPLQVAVWLLEQVLGSGTSRIDRTTFTTDTEPTKGHYVVSRFDNPLSGNDNSLERGTEALTVLSEIAFMMQGTFRSNGSGQIEYVPEPSNTSVLTIEKGEVDAEVTIEAQNSFRTNVVTLGPNSGGARDVKFELASPKGIRATNNVRYEKNIDTPWLNGQSYLIQPGVGAGSGSDNIQYPAVTIPATSTLIERGGWLYWDSDGFRITNPALYGIAGSRTAYNSFLDLYEPEDSVAEVDGSAGRYMFIQLIPSGPLSLTFPDVLWNGTDIRATGQPGSTGAAIPAESDRFVAELLCCTSFTDIRRQSDLGALLTNTNTPYTSTPPDDRYGTFRSAASVLFSPFDLLIDEPLPKAMMARIATSYNEGTFENGRIGFNTGWRDGAASVISGEVPAAWRLPSQYDDELSAIVNDVTIAVYIAQSLLARYEYGVPVIGLSLDIATGLRLQVGDIVTYVDDRILIDRWGKLDRSGASAGTFEVTEIGYRILEDTPAVDVVLTGFRPPDFFASSSASAAPPRRPGIQLTASRVVDNASNPVWIDDDGDGTEDTEVIVLR